MTILGGAIFGLWFASYVNGRIGRSEINSFSARNASGRSAKCGASSCRRDWRGRWGVDLVSPELIWVGYLFLFLFFSRQVLDHLLGSWFYAFLFLWFSAFLLLCFLLSLLLCFSAFCFSCFFAFLLLFFLPLCFCTSVPFYCYYSTFSFLQSCVFAALLPAPLLLCFLSLPSLCFSFSFALFCSVCILNEP